MKNFCLFLLLFFSISGIKAQTQNRIQFGYGKPNFVRKFHANHVFLNYQRNLNPRLYLAARTSFMGNSPSGNYFYNNEDIFSQYGTGNYQLQDLVPTDDATPGFIQFNPLHTYVSRLQLVTSAGFNFFLPERKFQMNVYGGGGLSYEKYKSITSGVAPGLVITDERVNSEEPFFAFEEHKRGMDFLLHTGLQISIALGEKFFLGAEATFETYDFGGFPVTQSLFIGKKF